MASNADAVAILCELADTCVDRFATRALEGHYGAAVPFLIQIAALAPGDPQASVTCQQCDQDHAQIVEFDPATARHFYCCAEAGRIEVEDAEIASLGFDPAWLIDWLQHEIPIGPPARSRALVPGRAWYLGKAVVGGTAVSVVFARGVSTQHDLAALAEQVSRIPPEGLGIVITTTTPMSELLLRLYRYLPLDLREIMRADGDRLYLDRARFGAWIKGFLKDLRRPAQARAGRPSQKSLVLEIHREREERHCSLSGVTAEARGIHSEIKSRHPDREPPAIKTIVRHLGGAAP
jgi:hypothetical protein